MKNRRIIIMIAVYALILVLIGIFQPREIDWRPTFGREDKIPYGAFVFYNQLNDIFPGSHIITSKESIYQTLHKKKFRNTNYILLESNFHASRDETRELLQFVESGNNVFIASQSMDYKFLDTLGLTLDYNSSLLYKHFTKTDSSEYLRLTVSDTKPGDSVKPFRFEASHIPEYFAASTQHHGYSGWNANQVENYEANEAITTADSASVSATIDTSTPVPVDSAALATAIADTTAEAVNEPMTEVATDTTPYIPLAKKVIELSMAGDTKPVFVKIPYGKGNIFLHSYPYAFTNYYLLNDTTRNYGERCLSYLPKGDVIWDEHYQLNGYQERHISTLGFILTNPSLRWAYYTGMIFLLVFILFSIKRRQRIIPVVEPFRNSSVEFAETVGKLYFNRGDHRNIAEKKIRHLMEYIRGRYYIETNELNTEFVNKLHVKSGIEKERIAFMVTVINDSLKRQQIPDTQLIQLNELIEYFKKYSN